MSKHEYKNSWYTKLQKECKSDEELESLEKYLEIIFVIRKKLRLRDSFEKEDKHGTIR